MNDLSNKESETPSQTPSDIPAEMTLAQFDAHMGWRGRYASQLKAQGRLVMSADGRRVRVAESIERIYASRDPARGYVRTRHAAARLPMHEGAAAASAGGWDEGLDESLDAHAAQPAAAAPKPRTPQWGVLGQVQPPHAQRDPSREHHDEEEAAAADFNFAAARARKEHFAALREEAAFRRDAGELITAADAQRSFAAAAAAVAAALEGWPAQLAVELAERSQADIIRILSQRCDELRTTLAAAVQALADKLAAAQQQAQA